MSSRAEMRPTKSGRSQAERGESKKPAHQEGIRRSSCRVAHPCRAMEWTDRQKSLLNDEEFQRFCPGDDARHGRCPGDGLFGSANR